MTAEKLPIPDPAALAHSQQVVDALVQSIDSEGPLSFGDFMQFALYGPGYGYYMTGSEKIGAAGDFVTAPSISPLFGACLAQQARQVLEITGGNILELGAGTGELAFTILTEMNKSDSLPERYEILEPSADLACRQRELLHSRLAEDLFQRVNWLSELPLEFVGVLIANEVLDAMPVERFVIGGGSNTADSIGQVFVGVEQGELCTAVQPAAPVIECEVHQLQQSLRRSLPAGYCSELNLLAGPWLQALSDSVSRGLVILIDYGYPQNEYYLPDRTQGTLRCYFRHHMHDDALIYPGLQDITADVDFTQIARAATRAGFDLHGYTSQAQFLLGNGLADHAAHISAVKEMERYAIAQQVNTLSGASAMGDRFQVMGLSKQLDADLQGFMRIDFSHRL